MPEMLGATVEYRNPDNWLVGAVWADVDRPNTGGWCMRTNRLALRMADAITSGLVYANPVVKVDVNGRSYVHCDDILPAGPIAFVLDELGV